jgi:hypothetical protein
VAQFDWDKEIAGTTGLGKSTPKIPVSAGLHTVGVTFLATNDVPGSELNRPFQRTMNTPGSIPGFLFYPHVGQVQIEGPYDISGAGDTASRRAILSCRPKTAAQEPACARSIVTTLARRAFRRPITAADLRILMPFYTAGRGEDGTFEAGVEAALQRILADPEFIYRGEPEPAAVRAGQAYPVSDLALASRLSFFLWSSIPDDQLITVAAQGRLKEPAVLERQVRRMLADPKSDALVRNFTGQWLGVRSLAASEPVVNLFPDFDDNLREAYEKEIELFFGAVVQEDRSVLELLDGNFTFVNERLAKQYGIPNIYGPHFRRVTLDKGTMRGGLLGQGSILAVTSYPDRTSPVVRGKWILENLLGTPPPPPIPNVGVLRPTNESGAVLSMRERMVQHRASPVCASCHSMMDPLGLALENFDAVGKYRTLGEGSGTIDASGVMPDGTKFSGPEGLKQALLNNPRFVATLTEKLMTYALGRGVAYYDAPAIRQILRDAAKDDYKMTTLIQGIVQSAPFRMRMAS